MTKTPHDQLARLLSGYWHTQAISVAAQLDLASHLKDGPRSPQELAQATGTNPMPSTAFSEPWRAWGSSPRTTSTTSP